MEFVILCIGRFSDMPNYPEFPEDKGPEVFDGKVLHSMDFSAMDNATATELIKGKKVAIVGSNKSAVDLAAQCADLNGKLSHSQIIYNSCQENKKGLFNLMAMNDQEQTIHAQ